MGILIDASVLIGIERGQLGIDEGVAGLSDEDDCLISAITASELLVGVHRAKGSRRRSRRAAFVEYVLRRFPVLPIDVQTARIHARVWAELQSRGRMIGAHDLWLAATCIAYGHILATGNVREFSRVPGLDLHIWPAK